MPLGNAMFSKSIVVLIVLPSGALFNCLKFLLPKKLFILCNGGAGGCAITGFKINR